MGPRRSRSARSRTRGLDPKILQATFREAAACRKSGIVINTFLRFVQKVCEIAKGKADVTSTMTLGQHVLMDFMLRKARRVG